MEDANEDRMMCIRLNGSWQMVERLVFASKDVLERYDAKLYMQCIGGTEISQVNNVDDSSLEKLFQKSNRFCLDIIHHFVITWCKC